MDFRDHLSMEDSSSQAGKLFVGQIPKDINEETLSAYFEEFGSIRELSIIRDTATGMSKGCAFVTFYELEEAEKAVENLHDKVKLPNALNFLQVRFAETQVEKENKLFVGMLPKTFNENELHQLFLAFGELKEVHIIRGPEGSPKGCAFVKFVDRDAAMSAINQLNETIPPGATRPLVVKFAEGKKISAKDQNDYGGNNYQKNESWFPQQNPPMGGQFLVDPNVQMNNVPRNFPYSMQSPVSAIGPSGAMMPFQMRPPVGGGQFSMGEPPRQVQMAPMGYGGMPPFGHGAVSAAPRQYRDNDGPNMQRNFGVPPPQHDQAHHQRPPEGPSGANLFIYHLPRDLTDADLATLFAPFGNVISAKVFVDKKTSDSKGFGFVSYDSFESANSAIESMNGFQIGSKRLKVQHKRVMGHGGSPFGLMGNEPDNHFPRNTMMHNLSNVPGNPMMNKMGHEMPQTLPVYNTARFDYGPPSGMPPPQFHMMSQMGGRPHPGYQQHNLEMDSFSLQEYMPSNNVKHL